MIIKLNSEQPQRLEGVGNLSRIRSDQETAGKVRPDSGRAASQDTMTLTATSSLLGELQEKLLNLPEVDNQRVAEVRQALNEGKYMADPERTASSLMAFERQLAQKDQ